MKLTLYAHNNDDWHEYADDDCETLGLELNSEAAEAIYDLYRSKPLYEIEVDFDVGTQRAMEVRIGNQVFRPIAM